ncbi:hypothetical protein JM84_0806 [Dokdonia sp. Hel_I_63]|jgi:hypothetical protein|uniref:hypothetical protein n=1 Tax=unclassified Dokdonia TaxID=2615033 RepID=UPI00020A60C4|nr:MULTISPECIES: hypothetical protein [unclassified Dokdonia]AEE18846.1 hypothetical protein Krodi_0862 [Dokdonia sp. 4H-3-7-5]TVZ21926.1 hypothetical protein JM84_0806 [Dokdonia sp. Hel_I_63]
MKKIYSLGVAIAIVLGVLSCEDQSSLEYKHADKEQIINCENQNNALLNEALYQFEQDIISAYDPESRLRNKAYANFVYVGFSGDAEYERLATPHTLAIRKELVKAGIIKDGGLKSNLMYSNIPCVLKNIEDPQLALMIEALVESNTMDPKLFNSRMRNFAYKSQTDRYTALYVALDTYYQQLTMTELPIKESNE